jgi:hypothetical protein
VSNSNGRNLFCSGTIKLENSTSNRRPLLSTSLKEFGVMSGDCIFVKVFITIYSICAKIMWWKKSGVSAGPISQKGG